LVFEREAFTDFSVWGIDGCGCSRSCRLKSVLIGLPWISIYWVYEAQPKWMSINCCLKT